MDTFFSWIGLIIISAAVIGGLIAGAYAIRNDIAERIRRRGIEIATREIGNQLIASSWWWSEHEPTQKLLMEIGQYYLRTGNPSLSEDNIRADWRARFNAKEPKDGPVIRAPADHVSY